MLLGKAFNRNENSKAKTAYKLNCMAHIIKFIFTGKSSSRHSFCIFYKIQKKNFLNVFYSDYAFTLIALLKWYKYKYSTKKNDSCIIYIDNQLEKKMKQDQMQLTNNYRYSDYTKLQTEFKIF